MTATFPLEGDCLDILRSLDSDSVDAIVTDPPYGLAEHKPAALIAALTAWAAGDREHVPDGKGFMNRSWDAFVPPPAVWDECLRVLKPGGHLLAFAGSRTADLMGLSVRMAGFEIRDTIMWVYGSGFPKSLDVSKAIDKAGARTGEAVALLKTELRGVFESSGMTLAQLNERCGFEASGYLRTSSTWATLFPSPDKWARMRAAVGGDDQLGEQFRSAEREVIGQRIHVQGGGSALQLRMGDRREVSADITAPATDDATRWSGFGTALKPAQEPIIVARKPLSGTVAATVLAHGTGALNIDATRVRTASSADEAAYQAKCASVVGLDSNRNGAAYGEWNEARTDSASSAGRWPSNVVFTHDPDCVDGGACVAGCPVADLDQQSGILHSQNPATRASKSKRVGATGFGSGDSIEYADKGGASRFFPVFRYQAKAPSRERPEVDGVKHPTVKPLALMQWLVRLVTPPKVNGRPGIVLDPFAGSGTTLEAARAEGFDSIGIERDPDYYQLILCRLGYLDEPAEVAS